MSEVVHLAGKCRIVEQRHGILVPTPGGELEVVRACGRADVHLHEEEGDLQIVDGSEQLGGSFAVRVGKEIAQVSGAEQVSAAAPTLSVSAETELKGLRLPARTDDEFTAVHTGEANTPHLQVPCRRSLYNPRSMLAPLSRSGAAGSRPFDVGPWSAGSFPELPGSVSTPLSGPSRGISRRLSLPISTDGPILRT